MTPERPFAPACSRQSFLETVGAGDALCRLESGLGAREPFLLVTGAPGTGKTALVHEAIARWDGRVATACLAYSALSGAELLEEIVLRFGGQPADGASRPKLMAALEHALGDIAGQGKVALVVVDDAQNLPAELLEELRLLANAAQQAGRPLEVLLVGLPELEARLDEPALAALRQRVSVRVSLEPLSAGETRRYLRHRVDAAGGDGASLFPRRTCLDLAALTQGVPRRINALANEALRLAAAAGSATVEPKHLQAAAAALRGDATAPATDEPDDADLAPAPDGFAPPPAGEAATTAEAPAWPAFRAPAPPAATAGEPATGPAPRAARVVAPVRARPRADDADTAPPPPPTSHDPREWVSRFVGDRGPVRIGSQVMGGAARVLERAEPFEPDAAGAPAKPALRRRPTAGLPARPRSRRGHVVRRATYAVLAASVVVAAVLFIVRSRRTPGAVAVPAVTATTSPAAPRRTARAAAREALPAVEVPAPDGDATGSPAPANAPIVSPTGRYTLEVGGYLDLQAALDERDHLQELTGIEGWVIPAEDGTNEPHRIVLGVYRARARANAAARMLTRSRTLGSATVVALPPRGARR